jgi:hypothetical protein
MSSTNNKMKFKCSSCNYLSDNKHCVIKHINKKTKCGTGEAELIELKVEICCEFCNRLMSTKPNLTRHLKVCKVKKTSVEKELEIEKQKVIELEKKLAISEALNKKPTTINNDNSTNINNIQIQLAPWNNPALPDNVEKYYNEALKKLFLSVPTLIKQIHFNKDHPENHNISIKNMRSGIAKVYNGKEWESMDEKDVIRSLINDYESTLTDYASEKNPKYNEKMQKIKDRDSEEKVYDDLHTEVKRVIYDRNHMVKIKN